MFTLPQLPYPDTALEPVVSAATLGFHHGKHHAGYVKKLNELLAGAAPRPLESVIAAADEAGEAAIFNNAAQCWNHSFHWLSMAPNAAGPSGELAAAIAAAFGDHEGLKAAFVAEGVGHFGSGWLWLVADAAGMVSLLSTHDAHGPPAQPGRVPLLVCDLWEHAYYLGYKNDRAGYLTAWFDALPDWRLAATQLAAARAGSSGWQHPAPMG